MVAPGYISGSEESSSDPLDLIKTSRQKSQKEPALPPPSLSSRFRGSQATRQDEQRPVRTSNSEEKKMTVMVQAPLRPWEYQPSVADHTVDEVLAEVDHPEGEVWYRIEYEDGNREDVSFDALTTLRNGQNALHFYLNGVDDAQSDDSIADSSAKSSSGKRTRERTKRHTGMVDSITYIGGSSESEDNGIVKKKQRHGQVRLSHSRTSRATRDSDSESNAPRKSLMRSTRQTRQSRQSRDSTTRTLEAATEADELTENQSNSDDSNILFYQPKRKSGRAKNFPSRSANKKGRIRRTTDSGSSSDHPIPTRKSTRDTGMIKKAYKERHEDEEMYVEEAFLPLIPKTISIREVYQPISRDSQFHFFHSHVCDVCEGVGSRSNKGNSPLIYCQGCSTSIHKVCLGYRNSREHLVTKVGQDHFVMQCRRCIGVAMKRDSLAPPLDTCQECKSVGLSCAGFSTRNTSKEEEKLRAENGGDDPITKVPDNLVNNADHVLFRCEKCQRTWHFEHLPPLSEIAKIPKDLNVLRNSRREAYSEWQCKECLQAPGKVQTLVAWRPMDQLSYEAGQTSNNFREDQREYLIKWAKLSYSKCFWLPGAWVWGVTAGVMRKAFLGREENVSPKWTVQDAIPKDYMRMEIIFDVKYDGYSASSLQSDKKHINDVRQVKVKFVGLGYDHTVWEEPPSSNDVDLWPDFRAAYDEYLSGIYFTSEPAADIKRRTQEFRNNAFVESTTQPSGLHRGDELFDYQKDGMNWLLYNFHSENNVILADEMGLGKTIQIIAFITALITEAPKCWPFLVVTPNSTCPNWRREIKKWAPSLRVVAYYGGKEARDIAYDYELFPGGSSKMRAHVVITSYDAIVIDSFFKKVKWIGLIVDEGQRLKNDENRLYIALRNMKFPFRVLLTGTPLQNNKKELFNLLQFLNPALNAEELDKEYQYITKDNISDLHDLIRPVMLRRTKIQVLDLPNMSQTIIPVTMSPVQKQLYKSILEKNAALIQAILDKNANKGVQKKERGNLNNILIQLRKCLCHPYVYNDKIEDRTLATDVMMRKFIHVSSKFRVLEIMLPKLRERGHRVLLFSQFLDQLSLLEDFLDFLGLRYQRLDGKINALEKQRRIDDFNATDSKLFAFLLSTRAGGVGINLATADTVIIMDPDFNPHQDLQAISRAHRLGQKETVLVFSFMTRFTAEEKIVQIGRKKMALDHALIESMDIEDAAAVDVESILKHGAKALFDENDETISKTYDPEEVEKLLDRTMVESAEVEKGASTQFSSARIWISDKATLTEDIDEFSIDASAEDEKVFEELAKDNEISKAKEVAEAQELGRGKRQRNVAHSPDYKSSGAAIDTDDDGGYILPAKKGRKRKNKEETDSEVDYAVAADPSDDDESVGKGQQIDPNELELGQEAGRSRSRYTDVSTSRRPFDATSTQAAHNAVASIPPSHNLSNSSSLDPQRINGYSASHLPGYGRTNPASIRPPPGPFSRFPQQSFLGTQAQIKPQQAKGHSGNQAISHLTYPPNFVLPPYPAIQRWNGIGYTEGGIGQEHQAIAQISQVHIAGVVPEKPNRHGIGHVQEGSGQDQRAGNISHCVVDKHFARELPPAGSRAAQGSDDAECARCAYPHLAISATCPSGASVAELRRMIDALDAPNTGVMDQPRFQRYRNVLKELIIKRDAYATKMRQKA